MRVLTPPGVAGVAVVAFSESERAAVAAVLQTLSGRPYEFGSPDAIGASPRLAALVLDGTTIDEVLVVDRGASAGDGRIELHLHGSMAVVDALRERFGEAATAPVSPANRLLRAALSPAQLDLALEQLAYEREPDRAPKPPRDDPEFDRRSRIARAHVEPCRVVLAGAQNAGKSTLLNRLLFRERALTGPLPGLTRDPVDEVTTLAGYPYRLVDTAGEGAADSAVDRAAIARGQQLRAGAFVVLVIDGSVGPSAADRAILGAAQDPAGVLVVANKTDLTAADWPADVPRDLTITATTDDSATLRKRFGEALQQRRELPPAGPVGGPAALP